MSLKNKQEKLPTFLDKNYEFIKNIGSEIDNIDDYSQVQQEELSKIERYKADTKHRENLINWTKKIVSLWLIFVCFLLILNNFLNVKLDSSVLITLLGTTTLNILGLPFIILRGLFQDNKSKKFEKD